MAISSFQEKQNRISGNEKTATTYERELKKPEKVFHI